MPLQLSYYTSVTKHMDLLDAILTIPKDLQVQLPRWQASALRVASPTVAIQVVVLARPLCHPSLQVVGVEASRL